VTRPGLLIVFSGPSGVGKSKVLEGAARLLPNLRKSVSVTTRPPRTGEVDGQHYHFRSAEQFDRMVAAGEFLEWAQYIDHRYGTPRAWVDVHRARGEDVVLEIDVQGGRQVRTVHPETVLVFVIPPTLAELRRRLEGRNTEPAEAMARRLEAAKGELEIARKEYQYIICNDRLDEAVQDFIGILRAERCRPTRLKLDL
jgi:guanylate kinase